jgi:tRNA U34 5-methylaminomethyl-2-thiouridine-forming methyltransferase MnmC
MSQLKLIITEDGSHTLYNAFLNEHYHSTHGAQQESRHVFINAGLKEAVKPGGSIRILEIGFGTGLNCMLTIQESARLKVETDYTALEPFPLPKEHIHALNYALLDGTSEYSDFFDLIHSVEEGVVQCGDLFRLTKFRLKLEVFEPAGLFDLIYFDAFAPGVQPELWTEAMFQKMFDCLVPGGILVTYCAKGEVKRAMKKAGFVVERLPGPPGKREMTRCRKPMV